MSAGLDAETDPAAQFLVVMFLQNAWAAQGPLGWLHVAAVAVRLANLDSPHTFLRAAVAASAGLPAEVVDRLMADPEPQVRRLTALHHRVPGPAMAQLVLEHGEAHHTGLYVSDRPGFPAEAFERLADHRLPDRRRLALRHAGLPGDVVTRLANDPDPAVRKAAATVGPVDRRDALLAG